MRDGEGWKIVSGRGLSRAIILVNSPILLIRDPPIRSGTTGCVGMVVGGKAFKPSNRFIAGAGCCMGGTGLLGVLKSKSKGGKKHRKEGRTQFKQFKKGQSDKHQEKFRQPEFLKQISIENDALGYIFSLSYSSNFLDFLEMKWFQTQINKEVLCHGSTCFALIAKHRM